jgi:hypothetical protein
MIGMPACQTKRKDKKKFKKILVFFVAWLYTIACDCANVRVADAGEVGTCHQPPDPTLHDMT